MNERLYHGNIPLVNGDNLAKPSLRAYYSIKIPSYTFLGSLRGKRVKVGIGIV